MRSEAGIRVHVCQDAESFEHNEATFFFTLSQSRRDTDDKAEERRNLMNNAAHHWYSDARVLILSQEWRKIMDVHTEAVWLLIIFLEKNVLLKLTLKTLWILKTVFFSC